MSGESVPKTKAKDWHSCSVGARARYLLDHPDEEIPSDVSLLVGDGEKEPRKIFKCHKYFLATVSSMFQAMFYGSFPQTDDPVCIPDVTPAAFQYMLRFACRDSAEPDDFGCLEDSLDTLYCAKKYLLENLECFCRDYIQLHIVLMLSGTGVCYVVIEKAPQMDEEDLAALALSSLAVGFDALKVMKGDDFLRLSYDGLKRIVDYPHLNAKEADIYEGVRRWVEHNVGIVRGKTMRDAFGPLVHSIRFPLLSAVELADGPVADGILTADEVTGIFQFLFSKVKPVLTFLTTLREPLPRPTLCRFQLMTAPATAGGEISSQNMFVIARPDLAPECCAFLEQLVTGKFHIRFASYDNEYSDSSCPFPAAVQQERNVLSHSIKNACWFEWDMEGDTVRNVRIGSASKPSECRSAVFGFVQNMGSGRQHWAPFSAWEDRRIRGIADFRIVP